MITYYKLFNLPWSNGSKPLDQSDLSHRAIRLEKKLDNQQYLDV